MGGWRASRSRRGRMKRWLDQKTGSDEVGLLTIKDDGDDGRSMRRQSPGTLT